MRSIPGAWFLPTPTVLAMDIDGQEDGRAAAGNQLLGGQWLNHEGCSTVHVFLGMPCPPPTVMWNWQMLIFWWHCSKTIIIGLCSAANLELCFAAKFGLCFAAKPGFCFAAKFGLCCSKAWALLCSKVWALLQQSLGFALQQKLDLVLQQSLSAVSSSGFALQQYVCLLWQSLSFVLQQSVDSVLHKTMRLKSQNLFCCKLMKKLQNMNRDMHPCFISWACEHSYKVWSGTCIYVSYELLIRATKYEHGHASIFLSWTCERNNKLCLELCFIPWILWI